MNLIARTARLLPILLSTVFIFAESSLAADAPHVPPPPDVTRAPAPSTVRARSQSPRTLDTRTLRGDRDSRRTSRVPVCKFVYNAGLPYIDRAGSRTYYEEGTALNHIRQLTASRQCRFELDCKVKSYFFPGCRAVENLGGGSRIVTELNDEQMFTISDNSIKGDLFSMSTVQIQRTSIYESGVAPYHDETQRGSITAESQFLSTLSWLQDNNICKSVTELETEQLNGGCQ